MSKTQFVIGQRWISESEADLGLGIVLDLANRRLTLSFPAAGERRTYAVDNAPVSRVKYQPGEQVRHNNGTRVKLTKVVEQAGCLLYTGTTKDGDEISFPEFELDSFVQFSTPKERLFAGQIDKHDEFFLRYQTLFFQHQHQQSQVFGLAGPRVQLLPHQLYIANQVSQRYAPRVLLADEVGLGKTIEAGLVLHQQLMSGRVQRALIVVPASLQHQWLVEMLRRFNLAFTLLDEARCNALCGLDSVEESVDYVDDFEDDTDTEKSANNINPFETAQLIICSLDFLTKNAYRYQQALETNWDLLLVDEAHHLTWTQKNGEAKASKAYQIVEGLAKKSKGLLLLTATPEQLGVESHFARLRLLDPDRYFDLQKLLDEQASYQPLNQLVQQLLQQKAEDKFWTAQERKTLTSYLSANDLEELEQLAKELPSAAIDKTIDYLLDRHGTGRVLFRNTRNSVRGFPSRVLESYPLDLGDQLASFQQLHLEKQIQAEYFWQQLSNHWWLQDPRVEWLSEWLRQHKREKILVICAKADTAQALEEFLRLRKGFATAIFHEGLNLIERDRAAAYFADQEDGAQLLVCSEIGSEGRNFQFAHHLVLFDLPLNPDLLEQRIGRLDRIGQTQDVKIHVPYYLQTAQEKLMLWYHQGVNAFEKTCAIGQSVYSEYADELLPALTATDEKAFTRLLEKTRTFADDLVSQLQQGRDQLLELNSCKPQVAEKLVDALADYDQDKKLIAYMESVFDCFGVDHEKHTETSLVLHPSDHMRIEQFPGLPESGLTVTYSRKQALSREDMQFMTWEHPLVRGAQDLILQTELGNTAFCTLKLPPFKAGSLMLEAIFVLHCAAPSELQLFRFMPESVLRVLLDDKGKDFSGLLPAEKLQSLLQKVPRHNAQELVRHARQELSGLLQKAEEMTEAKQSSLIAAAQESVRQELTNELSRLQALAKVNPNVRQDEIVYLQERLAASLHFLSLAKIRLDSLRVIMTI